jgi:hypothetical protein
MKRLSALITQIKLLEKEIADLDKLDALAQEDLKAASDPRLDIKVARTKITDARATIDLAVSKRKALEQLLSVQEDKLLSGLKRLIVLWNREIAAICSATKESIIQANLFTFNGDEAACRNFWDGRIQDQPAVLRFERMRYDDSMIRITERYRSSTSPALTDQHLDKLLGYFEAIHWRAVDAGALQPSCSATAVFRQRGYWAAKNTSQETSRDRFNESNLGGEIARLERQMVELGFGASYCMTIRAKVTAGRDDARALHLYSAALQRTLKAKARQRETAGKNPF